MKPIIKPEWVPSAYRTGEEQSISVIKQATNTKIRLLKNRIVGKKQKPI
jgi:hypothetical protein